MENIFHVILYIPNNYEVYRTDTILLWNLNLNIVFVYLYPNFL